MDKKCFFIAFASRIKRLNKKNGKNTCKLNRVWYIEATL